MFIEQGPRWNTALRQEGHVVLAMIGIARFVQDAWPLGGGRTIHYSVL